MRQSDKKDKSVPKLRVRPNLVCDLVAEPLRQALDVPAPGAALNVSGGTIICYGKFE